MHSINPLELPEIAQIIAGYLSYPPEPCPAGYRSNLESCLTVCKAWRYLYLPYFWREVNTGIYITSRGSTPFLDPIRQGQYRQFVQVLTVHNSLGSISKSLDYPNLRMLRLFIQVHINSNDEESRIVKDFVSRHPLLEFLDVTDISADIMDSAWTALLDHPRLEKLIMRGNGSFPEDFWRVCSRLRTLEWTHIYGSAIAIPRIPKGLMLPSIRRLRLEGQGVPDSMDLLDLINACPLLEELVWERGQSYDHSVWSRFGQLATQGSWPHLRQLTIESQTENEDLSQVIAAMHQATKIEMTANICGPLTFAALQRHASTLRHLKIPGANSREVRDVLRNFTRLEYLEAKSISARDVAEGGSWACTSLRRLSVKIMFTNNDDGLRFMVFERISHLAYLEEFDGSGGYQCGSKCGLIFRRQTGMGLLARLGRLRCVKLDSTFQEMNLDDVRWIINHWKRLEIFQGRLSKNRFKEEKLRGLFSKSGISPQAG